MKIHSHVVTGAAVVLCSVFAFAVTRQKAVPAGVPHVSSGDPKEGALFLEQSTGKFDLKPAEPGVGGAGKR